MSFTDATGKSFLSYRSTRRDEAKLLIDAQHDHGIPTWRDRDDLDEVPTSDELRHVLGDPLIANGVLWLTKDVANSDTIRKLEVPGLLARHARKDDNFFLVPVCADGLGYAEAAAVVDAQISASDLSNWNLPKAGSNPIVADDADVVARRVLRRRIAAVNHQLAPDVPLSLRLSTRVRPAFEPGHALSLDWFPRLEKDPADRIVWATRLLPALNEVANAIRKDGGGRQIVAAGLASIPAALALGVAFLAPGGQRITWKQYTPGRGEQLWNLDAHRENTGFQWNSAERDISGTDLAVLVSVTDDVEPAFAQTPKAWLPRFRAVTHVSGSSGPGRFDVLTPGQAVDISLTIADAIRESRHKYRPLSTIHLFMAAPLGIAMMVGQNLNTFGPIQTYEHVKSDPVGVYKSGVSLSA